MHELSRYQFEPLWTEGEYVLSRSVRDAELAPLLTVAPVVAQPAPESLQRLAHAYALREALEPAWATPPLALVHHQGRMTLVLADPGGALLAHLLGTPWEVTPFLRVAIGLAATLGQLHTRGLLHKDIKPAHILANPATGERWLTGVGIASRLPREHPAPEPPEVIAGTLAYMAPEQTGRMHRSVDTRSDLYALGVTLYQMLTGELPFTASDPMELVHCHIARRPVPPAEHTPGLPVALSTIVIDVLELGIAIRVLGSFQAFLVALQAIPQLFEQARHGVLLDVVPLLLQGEGKIAEAASGPQQTAFWVAARRRLDQRREIGQQRRVFVGGLFATASRTTAARYGQRGEPPRFDGLAFLDPFADCGARHPGGS